MSWGDVVQIHIYGNCNKLLLNLPFTQLLFINKIHPRTSGFCSCFTIPILADFRQSFRGFISITGQGIKTQLVSNESLGRDLQIRVRSLYFRLLLHGLSCITECQRAPKYFSFNPSFFFLSVPGHLYWIVSYWKTGKKIPIKLHMCT